VNKASTSTTEGFLAPPAVTRELLAYLRQVFPDKLPDIDISDRELGALIGRQRVITHIASMLLNQEEDLLANVLKAKD
jgi:hypothetical protein